MTGELRAITLDDAYNELVSEVACLIDIIAKEQNMQPTFLSAQFCSSVLEEINFKRNTNVH